MIMKRNLYLLFVIAGLFIGKAKAQVSNYAFSQSTGTYTSITGGTVYGSTTSDDQKFVNPAVPLGDTVSTGVGIPIGFNFTFNGQTFDRIAIDYNGWISFGSSSLTPSVNNQPYNVYDLYAIESPNPVTPVALRNRVAGLNIDLEAGASSQLRVQTLGLSGNQVCVIQWSNVHEYNFSTESFSFQIRLIQATGAVQVVYGPNTRTTDNGSDPQVGLGGAASSDFNNRSGNTWLTTTSGTTNSNVIYFYSGSVPPTGLTYAWTPVSCTPPTTVSFTSTAVPNVAISWSAVAGAAGYEYKIDTTAAAPTTAGTATTGITGTASGLPAGSAVFAHVRTNCGSTLSAWKTVAFIPCTSNILPANGATNVAIPTNFNWTPIAGISSYQILLSTNNGTTYPVSGVFGAPPLTGITGLTYSTTYRWYVRGVSGSDTAARTCATSTSTTFTTAAESTTPPNNPCNAPIALTTEVPVNGTTVGATQSFPSITCGGATSSGALDVWYSIQARTNGTATVTITNSSSSFDAVVVAYSGACTTLTPLNCADATANGGNETLTLTGLVAGQTYLIQVYGYTTTTSTTPGTGTFTITATGPALPVTGVTLSATRNGKIVQLGWQTLTEANNTGFEVQRSADGSGFTSFLKVASKAKDGNSTSAINYTAEDEKPFSGANYYRLKQTDKDGKISYSNVVLIKGQAVSNLVLSAIYPNPTKDILKAAIQSPTAEKITFVISDMAGKIISRIATSIISGDNTVSLNVGNLPSGNYLLKAICSNGCETAVQKFTKQ